MAMFSNKQKAEKEEEEEQFMINKLPPHWLDFQKPSKIQSTLWPLLSVVSIILAAITFVALQRGVTIHYVTDSDLAPIDLANQASTPVGYDDQHYGHCGSSAEEALALGCTFDVMVFGWIPPGCYNESMSQAWQNEWGPFEWKFEKNGTEHVPYERLGFDSMVWGSRRYHIIHCLYSWEQLHLAALEGYLLDDGAAPFSHTGHCRAVISKHSGEDQYIVNTWIKTMYNRCVKLR